MKGSPVTLASTMLGLLSSRTPAAAASAVSRLVSRQRFVGVAPRLWAEDSARPRSQLSQHRSGVFSAGKPLAPGGSAVVSGPIEALQQEVESRFAELASGRPLNISTAQMVQLLFEVGVADPKTTEAGEVLSTLMVHGYYRLTHPQKRDSYGPPPLPTVGLEEAKRWATMLFVQRMKAQELTAAGVQRKPVPRPQRPVCASIWCQCGYSVTGEKFCVLERMPVTAHASLKGGSAGEDAVAEPK